METTDFKISVAETPYATNLQSPARSTDSAAMPGECLADRILTSPIAKTMKPRKGRKPRKETQKAERSRSRSNDFSPRSPSVSPPRLKIPPLIPLKTVDQNEDKRNNGETMEKKKSKKRQKKTPEEKAAIKRKKDKQSFLRVLYDGSFSELFEDKYLVLTIGSLNAPKEKVFSETNQCSQNFTIQNVPGQRSETDNQVRRAGVRQLMLEDFLKDESQLTMEKKEKENPFFPSTSLHANQTVHDKNQSENLFFPPNLVKQPEVCASEPKQATEPAQNNAGSVAASDLPTLELNTDDLFLNLDLTQASFPELN